MPYLTPITEDRIFSFDWVGEHDGHNGEPGIDDDGEDRHESGTLNTSLVSASPNNSVYINGRLAGTVNSTGASSCNCCGSDVGKFKTCCSNIFICGNNAVTSKDLVTSKTHNITSLPDSSGNVLFNV